MSITFTTGNTFSNGDSATAVKLDAIVNSMTVTSTASTLFGFDGSGNATSVMASGGLTVSSGTVSIALRPLASSSVLTKNADTSPQQVSELTYTLAPGRYTFGFQGSGTQVGTGGYALGVSGTLVSSAVMWATDFLPISTTSSLVSFIGQTFPFNAGYITTTGGATHMSINGSFTCTSGGTIFPTFAQQNANSNSTLAAGSTFTVTAI